MSRLIACSILIVIWALIYLTNLGSSEFRSEEGHRVLPAVHMLDSGNYLVPYIAARPYLNKPPLINWITAASFKLLGVRNEWTARLPSALSILAVALTLAMLGRISLGPTGSFIAALCWLTNLGLIEKGRMIEIEAIYCSLFAFALLLWLVFWEQRRSPWLTFIVPWIFLGLGLLAKGPGHVLFFYLILGAVLWRNRRLRDLTHPAHFIGVLVMLGIFVAWVIPYLRALPSQSPLQAWSREAAVALHGEEGRSEDWLLNFPRGFAYLLPWILLLPFIRLSKITDRLQRNIAYGLAWGSIIPFVIVLLIPGTLPRYILPLEAPFCWVVGIAVANEAFQWSIKGIRVPPGLIFSFVTIGVIAAMIIFPLRSVTYLKRHERIKPIAAQINALVPSDQRLYAIDPDFQPYLFYVRAPITYLITLDELPGDAHYFLIQPRHQREFESNPRWAALRPKLLAHTPGYRKKESLLFQIEEPRASENR
jgi:4-amino-4-deoxy-L-arabinose transferase-like glycosyltransferase